MPRVSARVSCCTFFAVNVAQATNRGPPVEMSFSRKKKINPLQNKPASSFKYFLVLHQFLFLKIVYFFYLFVLAVVMTPMTVPLECLEAEFGCCDDQETLKTNPEGEGCPLLPGMTSE